MKVHTKKIKQRQHNNNHNNNNNKTLTFVCFTLGSCCPVFFRFGLLSFGSLLVYNFYLYPNNNNNNNKSN